MVMMTVIAHVYGDDDDDDGDESGTAWHKFTNDNKCFHMRAEAFAVTGCSLPHSPMAAIRVVGIMRDLEFVSPDTEFTDIEYIKYAYSVAAGFMYSDDNDEKGQDSSSSSSTSDASSCSSTSTSECMC